MLAPAACPPGTCSPCYLLLAVSGPPLPLPPPALPRNGCYYHSYQSGLGRCCMPQGRQGWSLLKSRWLGGGGGGEWHVEGVGGLRQKGRGRWGKSLWVGWRWGEGGQAAVRGSSCNSGHNPRSGTEPEMQHPPPPLSHTTSYLIPRLGAFLPCVKMRARGNLILESSKFGTWIVQLKIQGGIILWYFLL